MSIPIRAFIFLVFVCFLFPLHLFLKLIFNPTIKKTWTKKGRCLVQFFYSFVYIFMQILHEHLLKQLKRFYLFSIFINYHHLNRTLLSWLTTEMLFRSCILCRQKIFIFRCSWWLEVFRWVVPKVSTSESAKRQR